MWWCTHALCRSLSQNRLSDLAPAQFQDLTALGQMYARSLDHGRGKHVRLHRDLSQNHLSSLSPEQFRGLTALESLCVPPARQLVWRHVCSHGCRSLSRNDLNNLDPDLFQGLSKLQSLYVWTRGSCFHSLSVVRQTLF